MFFFIFKNGKLIIFLFNILILKDYLKILRLFVEFFFKNLEFFYPRKRLRKLHNRNDKLALLQILSY